MPAPSIQEMTVTYKLAILRFLWKQLLLGVASAIIPRLLDDNPSFDVRYQWYLSCVTDTDLIAFLKRSRAALRKGDVISMKDNMRDGVLHMHLDA
jgi:AdoMet-dependent proline di-methyltransferase